MPECSPGHDDKNDQSPCDHGPAKGTFSRGGGDSTVIRNGSVQQNPKDPHRLGNVLDLLFAQISESQIDLPFDLRMNRS